MIWSISDLHFDHSKVKTMDIFGENWINHEEKIISSWMSSVSEDDLVLIPGDISWGLKLENAYPDLEKIENLPGKKCLIKGNHDYWWQTKKKLEELDFKTINFLTNDHYEYEDCIVFGTRGWISKDFEDFTAQDEKIYKRELVRLRLSFDSYKGDSKKNKIVMLHYPPFNGDGTPNEFLEMVIKFGAKKCLYGHLHGDGHEFVREGNFGGVDVLCMSSDFVNFRLQKIRI